MKAWLKGGIIGAIPGILFYLTMCGPEWCGPVSRQMVGSEITTVLIVGIIVGVLIGFAYPGRYKKK